MRSGELERSGTTHLRPGRVSLPLPLPLQPGARPRSPRSPLGGLPGGCGGGPVVTTATQPPALGKLGEGMARRGKSIQRKAPLGPGGPNSASHWLCDHRHATSPLCASTATSVNPFQPLKTLPCEGAMRMKWTLCGNALYLERKTPHGAGQRLAHRRYLVSRSHCDSSLLGVGKRSCGNCRSLISRGTNT